MSTAAASGAAAPINDCGLLYHLVPAPTWTACKVEGRAYYPSTYEADGFIHLTKEAGLLLGVANHFYKASPDAWQLLEIDSTKLTAKVVFEPAAPVGDTPAKPAHEQQLFPHLYGTIDFPAVTRELAVARGPDGTFLSIEGLEGLTAASG